MTQTQQPRLRPARAADLPALLALERRCFAGDRLSARQYRAHLHNPRAWLVVALRDADLLGSALVFHRNDSRRARLYSIAVDPATRGLGLGARLLEAAERAARARRATHLRLEVREDNTPAIALYRARDYVEFGRKARYYEDGATALRFEKALTRR
jgi:ribosomal protein S18 acetylase RimI-like enzyme